MALEAVVSDGDVQIGSAAQRVSRKHQKQFCESAWQGHFLLLTANAGSVSAGLKIAGTNGAIRLMDQNAVGADGLVSVMFDDVWFAREFGEKHRQQ